MAKGITHRLYTGDLAFAFIAKRKRWYILSAIIVLVCIGAVLLRGLSLGIEFRGGTDFQAPMQVQEGTVEDVRTQLQNAEVAELDPQVFALGDNTIRVQVRALSTDETAQVREIIAEIAGADPEEVTYSAIGPSWGERISKDALIALTVFIILVMLLIWIWFRDWRMSLAAIIPLAHDLIVTVGVYALVGFTVTPATLIGVLTILGYSLYDTVVVFDQIRRNTRNLDDVNEPYGVLVNRAVNQVLIRSLNTTVIGILPVTGLLVAGSILGSGPLGDLGLALFVGMIAGAYSSIFLASPLLVEFNRKTPRIVEHDAAVAERVERQERRERAIEEETEAAEKQRAAVGAKSSSDRQQRARTTRAERKKRHG